MSKRKKPTCVSDDPDFTEAKLVRGVLDISHGEAIWIGGDPCISLPAGHPAVTLHLADMRRAARWKAEAKRLKKMLNKIEAVTDESHWSRYRRYKP